MSCHHRHRRTNDSGWRRARGPGGRTGSMGRVAGRAARPRSGLECRGSALVRSTTPLFASAAAPPRGATPSSEDLDVEFPQVAPLTDGGLRPRHRCPIIGASLIALYYGVNVLTAGQEVLTASTRRSRSRRRAPRSEPVYGDLPHRRRHLRRRRGRSSGRSSAIGASRATLTLPPQTHGNNIAEFVWTIVPTIIVIFMFIVSWQTLNSVDVNSPTAQTRSARSPASSSGRSSIDQADKAVYTEFQPLTKDGGGMYVPAGRTVQLQLFVSPKDVIHAFYVPQFLFKRDIVPGRTTAFDFTVDAADAGQTFRGQCAELCGTLHSTMLFDVKALTAPEFDAWLADKVAKASATPPPAPSGGPAGVGRPRRPGRDPQDHRPEHRLRADQPHGQGGSAVKSSSTTRTTVFRTTSRSIRAPRPGPRSSRARSSPVWRHRPMT